MMTAIEVKNLKKYYNKGKVKAVDGIKFEVPKGARFGFLEVGMGQEKRHEFVLGKLFIISIILFHSYNKY